MGNVQGGGACECPRVGAFFKLMTSRGQCPRGGCAWCSTHPSSDPPHLAGWLRACELMLVSIKELHLTFDLFPGTNVPTCVMTTITEEK